MDCRIVLAQTLPALGDWRGNLAHHVERAEAAADAGADAIVFPELSLTGYFLKDMTSALAVELAGAELGGLLALSQRVSIGVGLVERAPNGQLFNTYAWLEDGRVLHAHRKVHLVTYGMFEESRDLAAGDAYRAVESRLGRLGLLVCEDMWHLDGLYAHFLADCDAILVPSASPARGAEAPGPGWGSVRVWDTLLRAAALYTQTWVAYVNRVGFEDGIGFAGGTCVVDPFGGVAARLEGLDAGELTATLGAEALQRARVQTPLRRDERPWILERHLREALGARAAGSGT